MAKNNQILYRPSLIANINHAITTIFIGLIKAYRYGISPLLGCHCRFVPSCSCYAEQAVRVYGAWRGSYLALLRLAKCHPWHTGGEDPLPLCHLPMNKKIQRQSRWSIFNQQRN
jgi:uncharacterized protein